MRTSTDGAEPIIQAANTIGGDPQTRPVPTTATAPNRWAATRAAIAAGVTILLWASAFVVIRDVGEELSAGPMALARLAVAALVLTPLAVRGARPLLPRGRTLLLIVAYGLMWFAGYNVALNTAEQHIDAGTAALLVNVAPLLIAVGAGALLGEGFPRPLLIGTVVAFGGVAFMTAGNRGPSGDGDSVGILLGLLAAVLYAVSVLIQKVTLRGMDVLRSIWLGCVIGVIALFPYAGSLAHEIGSAPASAILGTAYLGAFPTAVAFTTWGYALRRIPAGRLGSLVGYLVTVVAVLLSWAFLSEVPSVPTLIGGTICLLGVTISQYRARKTDAPQR